MELAPKEVKNLNELDNMKKNTVILDIYDETVDLTDMSFCKNWIPNGTKLKSVKLHHEPGHYDETDKIKLIIEWEHCEST